jgi:hypothetical protein
MSNRDVLKLALEKISTVNAMDYEYQAWAREALTKQEQRSDRALADSEQLGGPVAIVCNKGPKFHHVAILTDSGKQLEDGAKLYTTPPQRDSSATPRTWVGLTLADKEEYVALDFGGNRLDAMDWADKRLKEKNT